MSLTNFTLKTPNIEFGLNKSEILPAILKQYNDLILVITGKKSLEQSDLIRNLLNKITNNNIMFHISTSGEPAPENIDNIVTEFKNKKIKCIISIGGGSVIDTGKAVAAMLCENYSIINFLEEFGHLKPSGKTIPHIALPTTAGTGSETTKNAVISKLGKDGFKKSLRHDNYIPQYAIIDPLLTLSCPKEITLISGLDALAQLIEGYLSTKSNIFTDTLAYSAIKKTITAFPQLYNNDLSNISHRIDMAYAAMISGITLTYGGLCALHGLASEIGYFSGAPHGLICGALLPVWFKKTIHKIIEQNDQINLTKIINLSKQITGLDTNDHYIIFQATSKLKEIVPDSIFNLLKQFPITISNKEHIAKTASNKNNPVELSISEKLDILNTIYP